MTRSLIRTQAPPGHGPVRVCLGLHNTRRVREWISDNDRNSNNARLDLTVMHGQAPDTCSGDVTVVAGAASPVAGPGYLGGVALGYPANLTCQWKIRGPAGHYLRVRLSLAVKHEVTV